ncbi:MAG: isoprenylcysteine carboxylmethyltransferase family protein [Nitrospirae bacterium]|nr:isoprenylcysteine carboxylmethyltransferase family protein [Nitrospirota bacterium]MBI3593564.1 isoprenylcysteine carboxylmethyltransferase family protein [Nitrospirota bacterium]
MEKFNKWIGHYRTFLSFCLAVLFLFLARPTPISIGLGIVFVFLGVVLRIWASGYLNKDTHDYVTVFGPYAYTRNPLYLGNFFLGLGFIVMGSHWFPLFLYFVLFFVIYRSTILDEEKLLTGMFGNPYLEYRSKVPRFFPHFKLNPPAPSLTVPFSWNQVTRREIRAWFGIAVILAYLIYKARVFNP